MNFLMNRLKPQSVSHAASLCVPALQPVDVLLPPAPAVLSRLLVANLSADSLQDPFLGLQRNKTKSWSHSLRCEKLLRKRSSQSDLGEREVVGQRHSFLAQQLLFLLSQLEVWVQLQQ